MSQKTFKILFNFGMKNFEFNDFFKNVEMISDINNLLVKVSYRGRLILKYTIQRLYALTH